MEAAMKRAEILDFLNANPGCHLATLEGNQPRVRGMFMYRADESGILFHTGSFKSLYRQIEHGKQVEVCFNSPDKQIRVAGKVDILNDKALKKEILEARPWLKSLMGQTGEDGLIVFRITGCQVTVWTMETNLAPTAYVDL
jgi:uncharacterized pyridoxamine 5'-phosphate oxidase family protein